MMSELIKSIGEAFDWNPPYETDGKHDFYRTETTVNKAAALLTDSQISKFKGTGSTAILVWDGEYEGVVAYNTAEISAMVEGVRMGDFDRLLKD